MLAKMIANCPSANAAQDFGARIGYVCAKACAVDLAGLAGDWTDAAFQMRATAGLNPRLHSPVCHFVLSWADTERPSDAEMIESAHRAVYELGGHEHQYVVAVHRDRPSPHVHIVLNRVHPTSGASLSLSHDYARLERACRRIEFEMGWPRDRGRFDSEIIDGDVLLLPKPTEHWARKSMDRTRGIRPDGRAVRGHERRTGLPALRDALPAETLAQIREKLDGCEGWSDVHAALRPYGLHYVIHRSGARIARKAGGWAMAACHLGAGYSLRRMVMRLGRFLSDADTLIGIPPSDTHGGTMTTVSPLAARLGSMLGPIIGQRKKRKQKRDKHRAARRDLAARQAAEARDLSAILAGSRTPVAQALRHVLRENHRNERMAWRTAKPTIARTTSDLTPELEEQAPDLMALRQYRHVLRDPRRNATGKKIDHRFADHTDMRQAWTLAGHTDIPALPRNLVDLLRRHPDDIRLDAGGTLLLARRNPAGSITGFDGLELPTFTSVYPARAEGGDGIGLLGPRNAETLVIVPDAGSALAHAATATAPYPLIAAVGDGLGTRTADQLQALTKGRATFIAYGHDPAHAETVENLRQILPEAKWRTRNPGTLWHDFVKGAAPESERPGHDEGPAQHSEPQKQPRPPF